MTEQTQTTDAPVIDTTDQAITPEQYQALQAEVEKLRKHSDTLLAEKKTEQQKQREAQAEKERQAEEIARKKGDFEQIEKQYQDKLADKDKLIEQLQTRINNDALDNASRGIASKLTDDTKNQALLQRFIKDRLSVSDGQVKVTDENGNATISTIDDLINEFKTSGQYDALIVGTKASGMGASGQGSNGQKQAHEYTESERIELAIKDPQRFKQLFST